ncbi:hypothetical protein FIM08_04240 [SAR202 cluster bacterium AC-647-N09_OGT_505m]|nr:hypothetical protein [SAR202 cluster bacterium AC-647-N09_OGT_505m]
MKFDDVVQAISRVNELRRISGAHVVDHRQLSNDELKAAITKAKPQYLHQETVHNNLEAALYKEPRNDFRVVSRLILIDVLLNQYGFEIPSSQMEERVIAIEQSIVNRSNEIDLVDLGCTNRESAHYKNVELYDFVLKVAWENENTKSPDEVNLLRKLRGRLNVTESDHRLIEAKLGNYPKPSNELHSRTEIHEVRRYLQGMGLLFAIRHDDDQDDVDIIPAELANIIREILGLELRADSYRALMDHKPLRRRTHLIEVLERSEIEIVRGDTVDTLVERVLDYVRPSKAITSTSPRYGLSNDQLAQWCRNLNEPVSGTMDDRLQRIISHYDQLRPRVEQEIDERASWYDFYAELASRSHDVLRLQHIIEKDLEIEAKFENATEYLFAEKLNHRPLRQPGSNNPDGLISLGNNYVMWDNKSKESPVNLRDHLRQFDEYMDQADKPVPIFLVIGPRFSPESEAESIRYHARHFDRNIALITANELKDLAEEWSSTSNNNRDEPFPLGLLAATGRFDRARLGKL